MKVVCGVGEGSNRPCGRRLGSADIAGDAIVVTERKYADEARTRWFEFNPYLGREDVNEPSGPKWLYCPKHGPVFVTAKDKKNGVLSARLLHW